MFNIHVYFQFVQIIFIYFPYLFLIQSLVTHCLQINAQDAYNLRFGRSLYAWKYKEIIFLMQPVSWSTKIKVTRNHRKKSFSDTQRNAIFFFHKTSSLAHACTDKHEIIPFHNILMKNLSIMYIYLPCVCLISLFLSNLYKSRLFTSDICFQFRVQNHLIFKLTHRMSTTSDLDVLYMHEKIRR
jgi:hypothetical protein